MNRIIDANLNRCTEGLRVLEEIARFFLNDEKLSAEIKNLRHGVCAAFDGQYEVLLLARDTQNDVGVNLINPTERQGIETIFKANVKRVQEALRVLGEYSNRQVLCDQFRYATYSLEKRIYEGLKMNLKKYMLEGRNLYLVTNSDNFESDDDFLNAVALALKSGVDVIQLREKSRPASEIVALGKKIRALTSEFGAIFIVNDRVDVAKIVQADGVHLGQEDIVPAMARVILGEKAIIGVSTHCPEHALKAMEEGADYIGVGPVFKTPTKPNKTPVGLEYVKWARLNCDIPFFAIGAINLENLCEVTQAGATRVAVIREIMYAKNIKETATKFKDMLQKGN